MEGNSFLKREHGAKAVGTEYRFVVSATRLPFESCALDKLVRRSAGRKLVLKFAVLVFRAGEFSLKFYTFLFQRCCLFANR